MKPIKQNNVVSCILVITFTTVFTLSAEGAKKVEDGTPDPVKDVPVRCQAQGTQNNTGQTVNDLHVTIYQKEKGVHVNAGEITAGGFTSGTGNLVGGFGHTDGLMHGMEADFSGAEIPPGGGISLNATLWLNKENQLWLRYYWTIDGEKVEGDKKPGGHRTNNPRKGGEGGNPDQQGGGGGEDNYVHFFYYYNEKNEPLLLCYVQLYASMEYIENINSIDWENIPPILSTPVWIAPYSWFSYAFETTGAYIGGHLYMRISVVDDPIIIHWDHPITAIETFIITDSVYNGMTNVLTDQPLNWHPPTDIEDPSFRVYFGTDPNVSLVYMGEETSITPPPMDFDTLYYWRVDTIDPNDGGPVVIPGPTWSFHTRTNNAAPIVDAGADPYVWLNNDGNPTSAAAHLDGTVSDDGLPYGTYSVKWEQVSGPETVRIDPNNTEDTTVTISTAGTYVFQLDADDGELVGTDTVQVYVGETACDAAKAMPEYMPPAGDLNSDCHVNLTDFAVFADNWLACNSLAPCD